MTDIIYKFRKAEESDLPFLINLRSRTMREHLENVGVNYEDNTQLQRIMDGFDYAQIITHNEQNIGLLKIDRKVSPWMFMQIQITPTFQRSGIGEKILRQIISDAKQVESGVTLKVLKKNPAKKLYERVGFKEFRTNEHSFFMTCALS